MANLKQIPTPTIPKPPIPKPPDISYASVVRKHDTIRTFDDDSYDADLAAIARKEPTMFRGEPAIFFTKEEIDTLSKPLRYTLIGKFLRGKPRIEGIRKFFITLGLKADYTIGLIDANHIMTHLKNEEDYHRIWMKEQWYVFNFPMAVSKWTPEFSPDIESPNVPVWVNFPKLPLHGFNRASIQYLAKAIGKPMKADLSTVSLLRPSMARACIEVDISRPVPKRIWIGNEENGFFQEVIYENLPSYCKKCFKVGHDTKNCILNVSGKKKEANTNADNTHNQGQNKPKLNREQDKGKEKIDERKEAQNKAQKKLKEKERDTQEIISNSKASEGLKDPVIIAEEEDHVPVTENEEVVNQKITLTQNQREVEELLENSKDSTIPEFSTFGDIVPETQINEESLNYGERKVDEVYDQINILETGKRSNNDDSEDDITDFDESEDGEIRVYASEENEEDKTLKNIVSPGYSTDTEVANSKQNVEDTKNGKLTKRKKRRERYKQSMVTRSMVSQNVERKNFNVSNV